MSKLLKKLIQFLTTPPKSGLELYIESKRPSNAAEVDHYAREYSYRNTNWRHGL